MSSFACKAKDLSVRRFEYLNFARNFEAYRSLFQTQPLKCQSEHGLSVDGGRHSQRIIHAPPPEYIAKVRKPRRARNSNPTVSQLLERRRPRAQRVLQDVRREQVSDRAGNLNFKIVAAGPSWRRRWRRPRRRRRPTSRVSLRVSYLHAPKNR